MTIYLFLNVGFWVWMVEPPLIANLGVVKSSFNQGSGPTALNDRFRVAKPPLLANGVVLPS
jgi:hypothetical protein